jgi:hypothetical protein
MAKGSPEEKFYIVPELNIRVSESWVNLVFWCQNEMPNGEIKVKIVNGQPTELLEKKERVRFDKQGGTATSTKPFNPKI